jgi:ketopantoate reductase
MRLNKALAVAGRCAIDCATLRELKEAIQELRAHSRNSVLADVSEDRITDIETLRKELALEPCAG